MDSDKVNPENGFEVAYQNGVHKQLPDDAENGSAINNTNGISEKPTESEISVLVGNIEEATLEDPVTNDNPSFELPKEVEESNKEHPKPSKPQKDRKLKKLSEPKVVSKTGPKASNNVKDSERSAKPAVGSLRSTKQPKKTKSVIDRQSQPKKDGKSDAANMEGLGEQTKPKPLTKGLPIKQDEEEEAQPSPSPKAEDTQPRKIGALPNYGFSFRCDQRAEKRREFYTKLEEKIQAKEVEKTTLQEKSKETQEAEIRMFRKSLTFKATPMPTFYQEPAPPKTELKKIPPTRAKSPRLGRRKSSIGGESFEENTTYPSQQERRFSLDVVPRAKVTPPANSRKPQRKSLPNSSSSKTANSSKKSNVDEVGQETPVADRVAISANQDLDAVPTLEVNEAHETVAVEH